MISIRVGGASGDATSSGESVDVGGVKGSLGDEVAFSGVVIFVGVATTSSGAVRARFLRRRRKWRCAAQQATSSKRRATPRMTGHNGKYQPATRVSAFGASGGRGEGDRRTI